ncbi:MAG: cytochrome c oxidase subunit I [Luteitalea sp.]|nr:cytochrome c oxidase subunit I [Luteitalea sp.]
MHDVRSTDPEGEAFQTEVQPRVHYLNATHGIAAWLLTKDHKRIGLLYLFAISVFFLIGGVFAMLVRLELLTPEGDLLSSEAYNTAFSMHGIIMVFFFLVPSIPAVFGNFFLPIMIGAKDVAFPKLNLMSWYIAMIAGFMILTTLLMGGVDTGWTFYPPYSTTGSTSNVVLAALAIFVMGFSSILTGLNFIVTVHTMRAPGMTWGRLPLFVWAQYATSLIMVLGTPVLAITLGLVFAERVFHFGIFDPKLGGDPILFQHLFWFYSHPAVYIMILPGMGVISELVAAFSRKQVFGYNFIAASSLAIAIVGFLVWGHHLFTSGQSAYAALVFSVLSFIVAIPSAIKVFNWTATLYRGSISLQSPMLYALGFIGLFTIGGLTGLFLAALGLDLHMQDTYFVIAHFHYIMVGGTLLAYLGALHYWWPKITGRLYTEGWAKVAAVTVFVGFNLTFFPQFLVGYLGMPRRYHAYVPEFQVLNVLSTAGASILAIGFILPACYLLHSLFKGEIAGRNPWGAYGLEWDTTTPPPPSNFEVTPIVTRPAYAYTHADVVEPYGGTTEGSGESGGQEVRSV